MKLFMSSWARGWVQCKFVHACDLHKMWCNTEKWNNPSSRATGQTEQGWSDFTRNPPTAKVYVSTVRAFQNIWLWFGIPVDDIQRENSEVMIFFVWLVGCCFDCWFLTLVLRKPITILTLDMWDFQLMWKCVKMQKKRNSYWFPKNNNFKQLIFFNWANWVQNTCSIVSLRNW